VAVELVHYDEAICEGRVIAFGAVPGRGTWEVYGEVGSVYVLEGDQRNARVQQKAFSSQEVEADALAYRVPTEVDLKLRLERKFRDDTLRVGGGREWGLGLGLGGSPGK